MKRNFCILFRLKAFLIIVIGTSANKTKETESLLQLWNSKMYIKKKHKGLIKGCCISLRLVLGPLALVRRNIIRENESVF